MVQNNQPNNTNYTKFEKARIIGGRALQLSMGAPFMIPLSKEDLEKLKYNTLEIAIKEFNAGVLKIDIVRPKPEYKTIETQKVKTITREDSLGSDEEVTDADAQMLD